MVRNTSAPTTDAASVCFGLSCCGLLHPRDPTTAVLGMILGEAGTHIIETISFPRKSNNLGDTMEENLGDVTKWSVVLEGDGRMLRFWRLIWPYLVTVGTMGLFLTVWVWFSGWPFALGATAIILLHEIGHMIGGALRSIPTRPPVFIPFLGAFVSVKEEPRNAYDEAVLAAGGPVLGLLATACVWAASAIYPEPVLPALARFGFALHAINLVPILPFDGGRIAAAVSPGIHRLARPFVIFLAVWADAVALAGMISGISRGGERTVPEGYNALVAGQRIQAGAAYLALLGVSLWAYVLAGGRFANLVFLGLGNHEPMPLTMAAGLWVGFMLISWAFHKYSAYAKDSQERDREIIHRARELEEQQAAQAGER